MNNELLIGTAGLVLSVLTYFAGVWRTERRHKKDDREKRVQRVFAKYMEFRRSNYTGGYDGSLKAGIATLESNDEIEEFSRLVVGHGELHPLGSDHGEVFRDVDRLSFFRFAAENQINLVATSIYDAIASFRAAKVR
jgi:hypothetical protein